MKELKKINFLGEECIAKNRNIISLRRINIYFRRWKNCLKNNVEKGKGIVPTT